MFFIAFPRNMIFAILLGFTMLFWINRGIILFIVLFFLGSQKIFSFIRQVLNHIVNVPNHFYTDSIIEPYFAIMGQISKVDGSVSKNSIKIVEKIIKDMRLNAKQRKRAITAFKSGKMSILIFIMPFKKSICTCYSILNSSNSFYKTSFV